MAERGEWGVAAIAAVQWGQIRRSQLIEVGMGRGAIAHRLRRGSLHRVLPSVYGVGHDRLGPAGRRAAALLYAGDDCVLSHGTAAALWGLAPEPGPVSVTIAGRTIRQPPGLRIHRVAALDIRDVRLQRGFPVTAPARTLIDYAAVATDAAVADALNEARVQALVDDRQLEEAMERCPLRSGIGRLKALLAAERGPALTRSDTEKRLRALVEQGQLPWPRFNVWLHGFLVDAVWDDARVVVEADGYLVHGRRAAFESDRRRDQVLAAEGYVVVRVTWRQLEHEPMAVLARLAQVLALARERRAAAKG